MANSEEPASATGRTTKPAWAVIARSVLRALASVIVFVTAYYLLPLDTSVTWAAIVILIAGFIVLTSLIAYHVHRILRSPFPGLRAIEGSCRDSSCVPAVVC